LDETAYISGNSYADAILDEYDTAVVNSVSAFIGIDTVLGANYPDTVDTDASAESDDLTVFAESEADCYGANGYMSNDDTGVFAGADTILGSRA